jgi:hypothetical protein
MIKYYCDICEEYVSVDSAGHLDFKGYGYSYIVRKFICEKCAGILSAAIESTLSQIEKKEEIICDGSDGDTGSSKHTSNKNWEKLTRKGGVSPSSLYK